MLAAALLWLAAGWRGGREAWARWSLLTLWFAVPIVRIAVPHSNFYDANRHFVEYVPALACLAGAGASALWEWLSPRLSAAASVFAAAALGGAWTVALAWPVVEYHPYEATYFNSLIGGLGGAQQKALFYVPPPHDWRANGTEGDYWSSSTRDAMRDLKQWVKSNDPVAVCGPGPYLAKANSVGNPGVAMEDWWENDYHTGPFMVVVPRETNCWWREIHEFERKRPVLKRVERGGGLIYEILGKPDGKEHALVSPHSWYEELVHPDDKIGQRLLRAQREANGRPVVQRVEPGGVIFYDVLDPVTGQVAIRQQP